MRPAAVVFGASAASARRGSRCPLPAARCPLPAAYAELRLGASVHDPAQALPEHTARDEPRGARAHAAPKGSDCRYYRASGELLVSIDHFRLCFDDEERLVAKDVIPRGGLPQRPSTDAEFAQRSAYCRPTTRRWCGSGRTGRTWPAHSAAAPPASCRSPGARTN
ncbi:hypothetical protein [Streptomyces sp. SD31]|uniref:hypothetical protein n=1 Tax=Streptomyces sp. SD31 TaxID=3452208 RepID=UPI003F8A5512